MDRLGRMMLLLSPLCRHTVDTISGMLCISCKQSAGVRVCVGAHPAVTAAAVHV